MKRQPVVEALARQLFEVGVRAANRALGGRDRMTTWDDLQPHVREGQYAMAAYVLRRFVRKERGT